MSRGGQEKDRSEPERRCIATGEVGPKEGLIRLVVSPDSVIVPDLLEKLPGRGLWITATPAAFATARKRGGFHRGAKSPVTVPENLEASVEQGLADRVVHLISLARKAGSAVAGFEKVKDWLAKEQAQVLLQASDGSERGKTKLRPPPGRDSFIGCLTADELGLAFGREHVIHGALAAGGLTKRVVEEAAKLSGMRGKDDGGTARRKGTKNR
ncbi:RNA-binding protein [Maritimibacter sp. DP1N21-5]|uniref:RNA-binding protein n=1 Tax=Maritimibacter sp. DP1N21-5 TaxID=2836867 RepID=UPI001C484800|nr:RNA-binding protein [Maritimibacter sp. DP1N21-5]MBV7411065.1 RNA-binding protein [Maritimibacter sp. DP1N21-5]